MVRRNGHNRNTLDEKMLKTDTDNNALGVYLNKFRNPLDQVVAQAKPGARGGTCWRGARG